MNTILKEDFEKIINNKIPWENLNHKTVFITGGTGFLGSLLIRFIDYLNKRQLWNIHIIALVRNEEKAKQVLGHYDIQYIVGDICRLPIIEERIHYIFHCAAITNSRLMIEQPVEVLEGIVLGTNNIMKLSYQKNVESIIYLSSMEVYGKVSDELDRVSEEDTGNVELLNARSCYPLGKQLSENICFNYYTEYDVPVKIARLSQVFGAGILESENRVFAQFAKSVINQENIVLHTEGSSSGNYCYTSDVILGLFLLLFNGSNGQSYNVVNERTSMTIKEMAELVASKVANGMIKVIFDIPANNKYGYAKETNIRLSANKLKELGWEPRYNLEEMYKRMIDYMKYQNIT